MCLYINIELINEKSIGKYLILVNKKTDENVTLPAKNLVRRAKYYYIFPWVNLSGDKVLFSY